ncbi:hydrogenase subunit MbhD domain-containing protein [Thermococcus sp.]
MIEIHLIILAIVVSFGFVFSYLAMKEHDLLKALALSSVQSTFFALGFYILAAPDIVLAYLSIAVGAYTALIILAISKTERYEVGE